MQNQFGYMDCWPVDQSGKPVTIPASDYQLCLNIGETGFQKAFRDERRKSAGNSKPDPARGIPPQRVPFFNQRCEHLLLPRPTGSPIQITGFLAQ